MVRRICIIGKTETSQIGCDENMNCKNCGAPIEKNGFCSYCKSYYKAEDWSHKSCSLPVNKQNHTQSRSNTVGFVRNQDNFSNERAITNIVRTRLKDMCSHALSLGKIYEEELLELIRLSDDYKSYGGNSYINVLIDKCRELPVTH